MAPRFPAFWTALAALALQACAGGGNDNVPVVRPLVAVQGEAAGAHCPLAGRQVRAGLDVNNDGTLAPSEVTSTQYVCNLVNAPPGITGLGGRLVLATLTSEAPGADCPEGGTRVSVGMDSNRDDALGDDEILSFDFVCGGSTPRHNLVAAAAEPPAGSCVNGGNRVITGSDADHDGVLNYGEIASNTVVCDAVPMSGLAWTDVQSSMALQANLGYAAFAPTALSFSLPASPTAGDMFRLVGTDSGGWSITQQSGQTMLVSQPTASTWPARQTSQSWHAIASSADGSKLVAGVNGGPLYTSTDHGVSWTQRMGTDSWFAAASSSDGVKLVAVTLNGHIFTSTNSGVSWTSREQVRDWTSVAASADGSKLVASVLGGQLYTSTDSGVTWVARASSRVWTSVASSADGQSLVAAAFGGTLYASTDAGATWNARETTRNWFAVASSADGSRLVAVVQNGRIFTSTDAGIHWTPHESARNWSGVASSDDGLRLIASAQGGQLYRSINGGTTWAPVESGRDWVGVASSADGRKLVAVDYNGTLHTSTAFTTLGASGSVSGVLNETIEIEYLGGGVFDAIRTEGELVVN